MSVSLLFTCSLYVRTYIHTYSAVSLSLLSSSFHPRPSSPEQTVPTELCHLCIPLSDRPKPLVIKTETSLDPSLLGGPCHRPRSNAYKQHHQLTQEDKRCITISVLLLFVGEGSACGSEETVCLLIVYDVILGICVNKMVEQ